MKYIVHQRLKQKVMCGNADLAVGAPCEEQDGIIYFAGYPVCKTTSQVAHDYIARDDDGQGLRRGKLTRAIVDKLAEHDDDHQARWDKIWASELCQKYRRTEHEDYWLWSHEFYNASILTLLYIAGLIGIKEES